MPTAIRRAEARPGAAHREVGRQRAHRIARALSPLTVAALAVGCAVECTSPGSDTSPAVQEPSAAPALARRASGYAIQVDFGTPLAVTPVNGLLHGLNAASPPDSLLLPLRPALWRIGTFDRLGRVATAGARAELVLSDLWGYPNYFTRRWPYEDYAAWDRFVDSVARQHASEPVVWEIWNEPDIRPMFWGGSDAQFLETYRRAYGRLRAVLGPAAVIAGPTYSQYFRERIVGFLDYCVANGCEANVLTWHELGPDIPAIADHLRDARRTLLENPAFAAVGIRELHVNEVVGEANHYRPGELLATLHYLEKGWADGAAKTCWNDSRGRSTCFNGTLDGLLTADTYQPTADWWVYKAYADGFEGRVAATSVTPEFVAMASRGGAQTGQAQVALAYTGNAAGASSISATITLQNLSALPFLQGRRSLTATLRRIPNAGEQAVPQTTLIRQQSVSISNDTGQVSLAGLQAHDAYLLTITS